MNSTIIKKNHAADPEIEFLTTSISQPYGREMAMPTAWELEFLRVMFGLNYFYEDSKGSSNVNFCGILWLSCKQNNFSLSFPGGFLYVYTDIFSTHKKIKYWKYHMRGLQLWNIKYMCFIWWFSRVVKKIRHQDVIRSKKILAITEFQIP